MPSEDSVIFCCSAADLWALFSQEGTPQVVGRQSQHVLTEGCSEHKALFTVDRSNPDCHKFSVTSAVWYPVDTGMFVTGSFDQEVKVTSHRMEELLSTSALQEEVILRGANDWNMSFADLGHQCASSGLQLFAASARVCSGHVACGCSALPGGSGGWRTTGTAFSRNDVGTLELLWGSNQ